MLAKDHVLAAILTRDTVRPEPEHIADRRERQLFWSHVMRDVNESTTMRLRASELLGKSQADFIDRHEIHTTWSLLADLEAHVRKHIADRAATGVLDGNEIQP